MTSPPNAKGMEGISDDILSPIRHDMTARQKFIIDCIVEDLATMLMKDKGLDIPEALKIVYNSSLFDKLYDTETGLYIQSSSYNYNILKKELDEGK